MIADKWWQTVAMLDVSSVLRALSATIITDRLLVRAVGKSDVPAYVRVLTNPTVQQYFHGPVAPEVALKAAASAIGKPGKFCVALRGSGEPVGFIGLARERRTGDLGITYVLLPEHWNRGYAREAVAAVLDSAFEHRPADDVPRIVAVGARANQRSCHLLEAIGMAHVRITNEAGGQFVVYAMTRPQ